jgi:hypothetical protein
VERFLGTKQVFTSRILSQNGINIDKFVNCVKVILSRQNTLVILQSSLSSGGSNA